MFQSLSPTPTNLVTALNLEMGVNYSIQAITPGSTGKYEKFDGTLVHVTQRAEAPATDEELSSLGIRYQNLERDVISYDGSTPIWAWVPHGRQVGGIVIEPAVS